MTKEWRTVLGKQNPFGNSLPETSTSRINDIWGLCQHWQQCPDRWKQTKTEILVELQYGPIPNLEEEKEEEAEETNAIEPYVCSLANNSYKLYKYNILFFFIVNYEMALRDFGSMGKEWEVPWNPLEWRSSVYENVLEFLYWGSDVLKFLLK